MSGRFNIIKQFLKSSTKPKTISSVKPNVGNLKKNKETMDKLIKTTDKYVLAADKKGFKDLARDLRKTGSKSLQKPEKILRTDKATGGRVGRKFGSPKSGEKVPSKLKGLKTNKKISGSYLIKDPKPIIKKATDPDVIKLDKQIKIAKNVGIGTAGAIAGAGVYGKAKKAFKKDDKEK